MENSIGDILKDWLLNIGISGEYANYVKNGIIIIGIIVVSIIANYVAKKIILKILDKIAKKTKTTWDDALIDKNVFNRLSQLAPALVIYFFAPFALIEYLLLLTIIQVAVKIYIIVIILMVVDSFFNAINHIYQSFEISKSKPIKGYIQVIKIITYLLGAIFIIAVLINKNPMSLFVSIGAISAILLLVFKDTIMGFVGSIQLSANDMVRPGDWISMPDYGADGTVIDMNLTSVRVQNWNKTISTIPTYALINNSFKNWRGMEESGGRRIKRSLNINMSSVKFCDNEMLKRFEKIQLISDYIKSKQKEFEEYNNKNSIDDSVIVNGRRQTNLGVFRAYLKAYLKNNKNINLDMTFLIRQLDPTELGIPLEIYVFSKIQDWALYEDVQSDIFDHLLATIPLFDLQVFQAPSGIDIQNLIEKE